MVSTPLILSVLLMGLVPASPKSGNDDLLQRLALAPPSMVDGRVLSAKHLSASLSASGVSIMDLQSGQQLYGWNANEQRPIGSLTKIMTAIVIAESHAMDEIVKVPNDIASVDGSVVSLPPGSRFSVGDMLSALLMASANDAAETLARFHSGSNEAFAEEMNARAKILGLHDTSFVNPSGLDDEGQWSTPRDLAWLATYALRNPDIRSRMSKSRLTIRSREGDAIALEHTHELLGRGNEVVAGKTGTTDAARQCLLSVIRENGREYLIVLLGSSERYADLRTVLRILSSIFA